MIEFIGREAALRQRESGREWRFLQLSVVSTDADPMPGDPILHRGEIVGYVTSGASGFRTDKVIALGYVAAAVSPEAAGLEIQILGCSYRAVYCREPLYDPGNIRCRA